VRFQENNHRIARITSSQTITLANRNVLTRFHLAAGRSDDLANTISLRPHGVLPTILSKYHRRAMLRRRFVLSMMFVTTRICSHGAAVQLGLRADGFRADRLRCGGDVWEDRTSSCLASLSRTTSGSVATNALGFKVERFGTADQRRITAVMIDLGWRPQRDQHG
jgi:hypothetical protein